MHVTRFIQPLGIIMVFLHAEAQASTGRLLQRGSNKRRVLGLELVGLSSRLVTLVSAPFNSAAALSVCAC